MDLRPAAAFAAAHVPGSLSIPVSRSFATWAGWLLPYDADVWLLTDQVAVGDVLPDAVQQAVHDLMLIGLDRVAGWFDGAALSARAAADAPMGSVPQVDAATLSERLMREPLSVVDVRGATEYAAGHLPDSRNVPVGLLHRTARHAPGRPAAGGAVPERRAFRDRGQRAAARGAARTW